VHFFTIISFARNKKVTQQAIVGIPKLHIGFVVEEK
jgi:hypothetical protein